MRYAIILAGGIGSRFWPLSRESEPKQFLNVCSSKPMLEEAIDKIRRLVKKDKIYIATNRSHNQKIRKCLRKFDIPLQNVLFEPGSKNTLAPISLLSKKISDLDSRAAVVVFPCDHFVKHRNRFLKILNKGINIANMGYIVSLGIHPTRPETGYGYIKIKSNIKNQKSGAYPIDRFIEKPKLQSAKKFIQDDRYYWNSGIFIFRPQVILKEIKRFTPAVYEIINKIQNKKYLNRLWHKLPSISVDYAIMEKTKNMVLLPADYGWLDLGSWQAIDVIARKDKGGNIFKGKSIDIASKNTIVWSDNRLVTTVGLENIIIVDTKDALLVCAKNKTQDIKKLVGILKEKNFKKQI